MTTDVEPIACPDCKGQGQKYLHLHYAKGKGQSGWQWKICWRCNGTKVITPEVLATIEAGKNLADYMRGLGLRNQLECLAGFGVNGVELSSALMGRLPLERIAEIRGMVDTLQKEPGTP